MELDVYVTFKKATSAHSSPSISSEVVAHYNPGDVVHLTHTVKNDGVVWGCYVSDSGASHYVCTVDEDGSACFDLVVPTPAAPEQQQQQQQVEKETCTKTISQLADEVILGKWDNGKKRKELLKAAGYDYYVVQFEVNRRLRKSPANPVDPAIVKYMQIGGDCSGHWRGNPEANGEPLPCWICWYGCFVLSILYARKEEPNEENVRKLVNENGDVVWEWARIGNKSDVIQDHSIARVSYKQSHYVYIKCRNQDGTYSGFDPVSGVFNDWDASKFKYSHKLY